MVAEARRRLLYHRNLAPDTFVFFFSRGPSETSWSVRDYSLPGLATRYAADFKDAAGHIPSATDIRTARTTIFLLTHTAQQIWRIDRARFGR
jgi:hypothetical protein